MNTIKEEEIPESFWEALFGFRDQDLEEARELFQTAMGLAKKYKDERDEARESLQQLQQPPQISAKLAGKMAGYTRSEQFSKLERERDEYKIGHDRYEKLRRLNLQQIKELYLKNLRTGEHFDILVDKLN